MSLGRIIFPFFESRHIFLMKKAWFRLAIVAYIAIVPIVFLSTTWLIWNIYFGPYAKSMLAPASSRCYQDLDLEYQTYLWNNTEQNFNLEERHAECKALLEVERKQEPRQWASVITVAFLGIVVAHYITQLFLFKVVIDFIVMGKR